MTGRIPDAWRSLFAECRAVVSGHHARWNDADGCFTVVSDSEPGLVRHVQVSGLVVGSSNVHLVFACDCPAGRRGRAISSGRTACRHAATVARRLERERLAWWRDSDTRWVAAGTLLAAAVAAAGDFTDDPLATVDALGHHDRPRMESNADRLRQQLAAGW